MSSCVRGELIALLEKDPLARQDENARNDGFDDYRITKRDLEE